MPSDEAELKLNQLLVGALFNKKEPQAVGDRHSWADALQRLLGKLQLWTRVVRSTETVGSGNDVYVMRHSTLKPSIPILLALKTLGYPPPQ